MAKNAKLKAETPAWHSMRTKETREIEDLLQKTEARFAKVDAYRYNSASIRVRIIDPRFEGKSGSERQDMVFPVLDRLNKRTCEDILLLLTMAPSEVNGPNRDLLVNQGFEYPLPSGL